MNQRKAKKLRKILNYDGNKEAEMIQADVKLYAVIDGVNGNHDIREEPVYERRTNEDRYLYRKLKKIYNGTINDPTVREELRKDTKKS